MGERDGLTSYQKSRRPGAWRPVEELDVYLRASEISDQIYLLVRDWNVLALRTVGEQLVRSTDSIVANLVEGDSAGTPKDSSRFFRYARNSGREARHWLRRCHRRELISQGQFETLLSELTQVVRMVNGLLRHRTQLIVREQSSAGPDPFIEDDGDAL